MPSRIEDYALIGDCHTGALVAKDGSIDWLCLPRFDSAACFAALLGTPEHGRWLVAPQGEFRVKRRYRDGTLILETEFEGAAGAATLVDFMPPRASHVALIRMVIGRRGHLPMRSELILRPDYGSLIPWVRRLDGGITAIAGPDAFRLCADVELAGEDFKTVSEFDVAAGETVTFSMSWFPSHESPPECQSADSALAAAEAWWREWSGRCQYQGQWFEPVLRSLITLKGLTYAPTGGIAAALTTSLPERLGGTRNWDYRCCWPRDATFTLFALLEAGYVDEARAFRDWLLRAIAGAPSQLQSVYGLSGEHRLLEFELPWLPGYENSAPVRAGNLAYTQLQLDVYGEIMATAFLAYKRGLTPDENAWHVQRVMLEHLESIWREPDEGIWEIRAEPRQYTHSRALVWVAADRAVQMIGQFYTDGPLERWRRWRDEIHAEVCAKGFNSKLNAFVQYYGATELDASLLVLPLVKFLPADDPRIIGTVDAIRRHLLQDGLVMRYRSDPAVDGLPQGEGVFLLCSFWLVNCLWLMGQRDEALELFERLLSLRNDVGLLAEEYDPRTQRFLGNFPQAFSHVALINSAVALSQGQVQAPKQEGAWGR